MRTSTASSALPNVLYDEFGRKFEYLRLSITDRCNFKCQYCLPDGDQSSAKTSFLSVEESLTLVKAFAMMGTRKVRITGGEPALRRDLTDLIAALSALPEIEKVSLTTNGYNLLKYIDRWHAAGLSSINVSVDSFDPRQFEQITGDNRLTLILKGIERAQALGMSVKINSVLLKTYAADQWQHCLDWVKHHKLTLRFIELMQTGDNRDYFNVQHQSGELIRQRMLAQGWSLVAPEQYAGPALEYSHPDYLGKIGLIMPYSKDFCVSCNRLRVTAQGKLHLCLFASDAYDLRSAINSADPLAVVQQVKSLIGLKLDKHYLQDGNSGITRHLAMLGG